MPLTRAVNAGSRPFWIAALLVALSLTGGIAQAGRSVPNTLGPDLTSPPTVSLPDEKPSVRHATQRPSYTFDLRGQRAALAGPRVFGHDWGGRLLSLEQGDGDGGTETWRFRYDPLGRRVMQIDGDGVARVRVPFGEQIVEEYVVQEDGSAEPSRRSYWLEGIDRLAGYDWDADFDGELESTYGVLTDPQGTVRAVVHDDGKLVESYTYRTDGSFLIGAGL